MSTSFDILIISYKRQELLKNCLNSIVIDNLVHESQIYVAINGEDQESFDFVKATYPKIHLTSLTKTTPAEARNQLIKSSNSQWVLFLDDDVILPKGYIKKSQELIGYTEVDILGGPDTLYPNSSYFETCVHLAFLSPMATSKTRHRHLKKDHRGLSLADEKKLILCNLWAKRSCFSNVLFDSRFRRNEENVLLHILKNKSFKIFYTNEIFVFHKRKSNFAQIIAAIFNSGKFRMRMFVHYPTSFSLIFLVPLFFLCFLTMASLLPSLITSFVLGLYFGLVLAFSIYIALKEKRISTLPLLILLHPIINLAYGTGSLVGLLSYFNKRENN